MRSIRFEIYALSVAFVLAGSAYAQVLDGTLKKIKDSSTFTLGYVESAPPFSFPGPDKRKGAPRDAGAAN
jgi:hypothetical protein